MNLLIDSLDHHWQHRNDYFVGGNMFLYYSAAPVKNQVKNQDFRGPDFFAVLGVERQRDRKYWAIWDEGGQYPDVIIELMSDSTATIDLTTKKHRYERTFKTADYSVYDPYDPRSLQGWHLGEDQRYQALQADDRGWLWSQALGLWLGLWQGEIHRESALWLRFYVQTATSFNWIPKPPKNRHNKLNNRQNRPCNRQSKPNNVPSDSLPNCVLWGLIRLSDHRCSDHNRLERSLCSSRDP